MIQLLHSYIFTQEKSIICPYKDSYSNVHNNLFVPNMSTNLEMGVGRRITKKHGTLLGAMHVTIVLMVVFMDVCIYQNLSNCMLWICAVCCVIYTSIKVFLIYANKKIKTNREKNMIYKNTTHNQFLFIN